MQDQKDNHLYLKQIMLAMLQKQHFQLQRVYTKGDSLQVLNDYLEEITTLLPLSIADIYKLYIGSPLIDAGGGYFNKSDIEIIKQVIIEIDKECGVFDTAYQQCKYIITLIPNFK